MRYLIILLVCCATACTSTDKLAKILYQPIEDTRSTCAVIAPQIRHDLSKLESTGRPISTRMERDYLLPAIIYWQWERSVLCTMDPLAVGQNFVEMVRCHADSMGMEALLGERYLEFAVEQVPHSFRYREEGYMLAFLLWGQGAIADRFESRSGDLIVRYRIMADTSVLHTGLVQLTHAVAPERNGIRSKKKQARRFVERSARNLNAMARETTRTMIRNIAPAVQEDPPKR